MVAIMPEGPAYSSDDCHIWLLMKNYHLYSVRLGLILVIYFI